MVTRKKIQELCSTIVSGGTPSTQHKEWYDGDIPWLNTKEVKFNKIESTERSITSEGLANCSAKWVPANTVVVAMYGATAGNVAITGIPLTTNQACCNLIVNPDVADYRYVYYALMKANKQLKSLANGGAQQNLSVKQIKDFAIPVPYIDEQREIAEILYKLDEKINLNSKINDNLYAVLEAVYQEKFTKPKSESKIGILSDICFYANDKIDVSKLDTRSYFSTENMLPEKKGASNATQLPTVSKVTACSRGDTLISNIRPYFKKIVYSEIKCGCSNDVLCFSPKSQKYSSYLFSTLFDDAFFAFMTAGSKGTKMPRGDKVQIMTYPVKLPADNEVEAFNTVAIPILKQIHSNNMENRELASLRDSLLKTLLSDATK